MTEGDDGDVVREVQVDNTTLIVSIPKSKGDAIKKEVRHRLDDRSHSIEKGTLHYVDSDYEMQGVDRGDRIEVVITGLSCKIRMGTDISDHNVGATCRWVLNCSPSVKAVGGFEISERYRVKQ